MVHSWNGAEIILAESPILFHLILMEVHICWLGITFLLSQIVSVIWHHWTLML